MRAHRRHSSLRTRFGDRAAVLIETMLLRRRAAAKFEDPSRWLFTDDALQQATAQRSPHIGRSG